MAKEDIEKYDEDALDTELTKEQLELLEIEKEQSVKTRNGQVEFNSVNHSERAEKFGRVSDGDTTKYVNIALEYFGHRCALSGERFTKFDGKVQKTSAKSNLSAEHVVALCLGGDDIVPNLVPTVLQYNLRKNGYYLLDYWDKQKDTEGKSLYSPYRLLKLVNYMMKSIEARDLKTIKDYRKAIMTPNVIDEFLAEIEKQDELETDNSKKKIHSDTLTATTVDEDNKKILTEVPQVEGNIPTQREQQERFRQNEIDMMDIFLSDAVGLLNRTQELQQIQLKDKDTNEISLQDKLNDMLKSTIGVIPFEVEVRNAILEKLEALGIKENKYSVANDLLNNTPILKMSKENQENAKTIVEDYIENQLTRIRETQILSEEQLKTVISNMPIILYNEKEMSKIKLWSTYRSERFEELIFGNYTSTDKFVDAIEVLKRNEIKLVYEDENGKIVNIIKQEDTIEKMLERYPNLTNEQKEKIQGELEELGINPNIGTSLNTQKNDKNKEKFEKALIELRTKLQQEGIEITEEEWRFLVEKRQISQNPTEDMVNAIEVLKRNGIKLVYEDEKGKIVNTIQSRDTIGKMLERYPNLTKEQKEKIERELEELGIKSNKVLSLREQKLDKNKEKFEKALTELRSKLQQEGIEITETEWKCLTERQKSQNATEDMVNVIEVLKRNGINLVYEDENGEIVNTIQREDTIEKMLERYPNLTKEQKEKIQRELEELGIKSNIGLSIKEQKRDKNKEKFEKALIELRTKLEQEGIEITEEEWKVLVETQINQNATEDMVNAIEVLKRNGINLVYEDEKGKIVNTIQQRDTIEKMLERYPNLTKEQKEKTQEELEETGINQNIGQSLETQKLDRNKEKFEKALTELRSKLQQEGIEITEDEWKKLTERQISQNATEDMVNAIEVLKRNGIKLVYEDEKGKIVNTIQSRDTIGKMLERYPNLTKEQKEKIERELEELGIKSNKVLSLREQKLDKNKEKFEKALIELRTKLEQEGIEITKEEWKCLVEKKQRSQNPTEDIINVIEVLKRNGINLVYEDNKGKIVNTIQAKDTIEKVLERYPNLTKVQKEKIQRELEELGINPNIGQSLNNQKNGKNIENFEKALIELRIKLEQEGIEITEDEWKVLAERQISQNPTEDMVNAIEVLKRNGINLVYEDENGKIVNTIQGRDTIETMLERYPNLTEKQKEKIYGELEELRINSNIGTSLKTQKNDKNKEKFEKALIELRAKLQQAGIEISQDEWKLLTEKSTQKKVKQTVVEQKNKDELGQNQQIEEDIFEETIRQAEQAKESEVSAR